MELDFLKEEKVQTVVVSSGNKNTKPIEVTKKVVDITYDQARGNLEQPCQIQSTLPYVLRAVKNATDQKLQVLRSLKEVLIRRANGERVVSLHEADIMLRTGAKYDGEVISKSIHLFGGFLCEDNATLSDDVFALRIHYNKGLEWNLKKRATESEDKQKRGDEKLAAIVRMLAEKGFPLHPEEQVNGFDQEFLKPEYLTYEQTAFLLSEATKLRSIKDKELAEKKS